MLQGQSCVGEVCGETWIHLWNAMPLHAKVLLESMLSVANFGSCDACDSGYQRHILSGHHLIPKHDGGLVFLIGWYTMDASNFDRKAYTQIII